MYAMPLKPTRQTRQPGGALALGARWRVASWVCLVGCCAVIQAQPAPYGGRLPSTEMVPRLVQPVMFEPDVDHGYQFAGCYGTIEVLRSGPLLAGVVEARRPFREGIKTCFNR